MVPKFNSKTHLKKTFLLYCTFLPFLLLPALLSFRVNSVSSILPFIPLTSFVFSSLFLLFSPLILLFFLLLFSIFLFFYSGFRIRIHFLRIRIQWIRMEANTDPDTDPDPDPIRIQGFNDQKLKKNNS